MMSAAYEAPVPPATEPVTTAPRSSALPVSGAALGLFGIFMVAVSAWGGIVPYVGPLFGYSADGSAAWHWNLAHALLALAPGGAGVVAGLAMIAAAGRVRFGLGRATLAAAGLLAGLSGAWFLLGPPAWPVLESTYLLPASPLRFLEHVVGYSLGPGIVLGAVGSYALGWAVRHRRVSLATLGKPLESGPRHLSSTVPPATTPEV